MFEEAVEKLENEMTKNESHPYIQLIGKYLLAHLEEKPEHAELILSEDKTIAKSLDAMRRYAETKRHGNMAVLTDEEGYAVVQHYFGCWEGEPIDLPPELAPCPVATTTTPVRSATKSTQAATQTRAERTHKSNSSDPGQMSLFDFAQDAAN